MSGIENVQSNTEALDPHRMGGLAPKNNSKRRRSAKDEDARQKLHGRLMDWLMQERDKQAENRYQMAIDEDFYDGIQWSDEEILALHERGQAPLVYNQVKPTINWMIGTERRTRIDGKVLPREESDEEAAEVKSKLLKYLSDVNRTPFSRSEQFKNMIVAGMGWMEDGINTDPTAELLMTRGVSWKNMYHDSNSQNLDMNVDGRYQFRWSFVDLDIAQALIPDYNEVLKAAALNESQVAGDEDNPHYYLGERVSNSANGDYASVSRRGMGSTDGHNARQRVKLIECWYKVPKPCRMCRSDEAEAKHLAGEEWDDKNPEMVDLYRKGFLSVVSHVKMEMRVAIMTENRLLYEEKSPYKHNRFPFTPLWCYRRARDGMPYGVVRDIRDAQIDYNKRASKALYILSTVRVIMEDGAVEDVEELRAEVARPDAVIVKQRSKELVIEQDKELAEQHLKLMFMDGQMIRDVGGVTDQNLGKDSKDLSGSAIGKLQDQGTIVTAAIFDNLRLGVQMQTELQLALLEQFYSAKKVVRIVGENKPVEWLTINEQDENGEYINDITRSKADFIVSEQDFKASMRQAMFESMMDLVGKLPPEVGLSLLDMVIDFADVPNKEEIVARIRKINGQADPSRKPTPEEEAAMQAKQQKAAELEQLNEDMLRANLANLQATTAKLNADAQKSGADHDRLVATAIETQVRAAYQALQAGQIVGQMPGTAAVADAILAGAGYVDKGGSDPNLPAPAMAAPPTLPLAQPPAAGQPLPELQQADGAAAGIETMAADGIQRLAKGGPVVGAGTETSDSVPIRASNGEWVLNAAAVKALGPQVLHTINEIARQGGDLYDIQRQFREQHPVFDAALNFVPGVGALAAADDVAQALANRDYSGAALNAIGFIPGGKLLKGAAKAIDKADTVARTAMVARGSGHLVDTASDVVHGAAVGAGAVGAAAYGSDLVDRERAAGKKRDEKQ